MVPWITQTRAINIYGMRRTTIVASDELLERLHQIAGERGISMAELIREALLDKMESYHLQPRSLGIGSSGFADTARLAGEQRPEPR